MNYTKGKIENIEQYRGYVICIEHSLNIFEKVKEDDFPIYTICKMGRCFQGTLEDTRKFIDAMFAKYEESSK